MAKGSFRYRVRCLTIHRSRLPPQNTTPPRAAASPCRHAEKAGADYGVDVRDILVELGKRRMVGGQEDMITDVALDMLKTA